jgi:hypothetical protein
VQGASIGEHGSPTEPTMGDIRMAARDSKRSSSKSRKSGSRTTGAGGAGRAGSRSGEETKRRTSTGGSGTGRKSAAKKSAARAAVESRGGATKGRASQARGEGARKSASSQRSTERPASGSRGRKTAASGRGRIDALKLLKEDHERVDGLFKKFDRMKEGDGRKQELLQTILEEVRIHAQVEEELFYPALRTLFEEGGKEKELELIEEADVEHETVKWLMEQLDGNQSDEHTRDARVKVMGEYIRHHVEEEEGEIFKAAKKVDLDLEELGRQLDARKRQLKGEEPADQEAMGEGSMQISEPAQMATSGSRHH